MKYCIFLFFTLLCYTAYAQLNVRVQWQFNRSADSGDTIYYEADRKLEWKDFKGDPERRSIAAAETSSGFGYDQSMKSRNGKGTIIITVYCFYNKFKSWVKPGMRSDYALTHEQHHFDITYIQTCLFIKKLKAAVFSLNNYNEVVEKIYDECFRELENNQNTYDSQTRNGQLKNIQEAWNRKIEDQLAALVTN